jgi:hypothetical protein
MALLIGGICSGLALGLAGVGGAGAVSEKTSTPLLPDAWAAGVDVPACGSTVGRIEPRGLAGRRCLPSHLASFGDLEAAASAFTGTINAAATNMLVTRLRITRPFMWLRD